MDAVVGGYISQPNDFQLRSMFPEENIQVSRYNGIWEYSDDDASSSNLIDESSCSGEGVGASGREETDHSDAIIKFIGDMLMEEEDLENKPCMLHDCLALQATEKSLYDVLNNNSPTEFTTSPDSTTSSPPPLPNHEPSEIQPQFMSSLTQDSLMDYLFFASNTLLDQTKQQPEKVNPRRSPTRDKKSRHRECTEDQRSNKQLANSTDADPEPFEISDPVLLCSISDQMLAIPDGLSDQAGMKKSQAKRGSNRVRPRGGGGGGGSRKQDIIKEVVDLRSLLMQCAQAVANFDTRTVTELLLRIRQHSSPEGDGTERLAHYFANALEARLMGTGTALYTAISSTRISAADILKAYKIFITACPFNKMSNLLANRTIRKLAAGSTKLHIIDFGILYGYQWPCLIQTLSERPGGPPKLRITGVDFPQPGFRPADRVQDTGRRLAKYCKRFGVPFEYHVIAQKWETIKLEDLKIQKDELVVVNSLYRLHNLADESVTVQSPRDAVLNLIQEIKPQMFIHGISNGTYNTPFFVTRFREAMFHYSAMFDMFEATVEREDPDRRRFEEQVFGKDVMNIIACEGTERVERPETYKQGQARNVRAGFRQVALDREVLEYIRNKLRREYHKDFSVDEDGKWMLQGWKGRVSHAISCWQPADAAATFTTRA